MHEALQALEVSTVKIEEKPTIKRLMQLYLHDFSEFAEIDEPFGDVDENGVFEHQDLDSYWTNQKREAVLFRLDKQIAGFALINEWSAIGTPTDRSIAEFCILRKYRRAGVGKSAASKIIRDRVGTWEIPVAAYNKPAIKFWRAVALSLPEFIVEGISGDGVRWAGPIWRLTPNQSPRNVETG